MSNQTSIEKFGTTRSEDKYYGNILLDKYGQVYSYGKHYPLLFKVGSYTFINVYGYSSSTGKHISIAVYVDKRVTPYFE